MKLFYVIIFLLFFQNCSFDNKTGIWKNENIVSKKDINLFEAFEPLSSTNKTFDKIIPVNKDLKFTATSSINNSSWKEINFDKSNNSKNFSYNNSNQLIFKSKKITKHKTNNFILFEDDKLIASDQKGNIIIYSVKENKEIFKYNFYKKQYKKINKVLNLIIENNILYISDNIGFLYAYNFKKNKIIWAKNYKIPFRSNFKIMNNILVGANQNNELIFFNKENGKIIKSIPTEETTVKNKFINNLSLSENSLFFLNTYGSLYSINPLNLKINWFLNLNSSLDLNPGNLFDGNEVVVDQGKVLITSDKSIYLLDEKNGTIIYKQNISSAIKPIILNNYLFLITKNSFLVSLDFNTGKILYSYDIKTKISEFLNIKKNKNKISIKNLLIANNDLFIILKNSYSLNLSLNGNIKSINKLPSKIISQPIFVNNTMLYLNSKNKIAIVD
jgi:outer membrane protein assembly factor BamB